MSNPASDRNEPRTAAGRELIEAAHRGDVRGRLVAAVKAIEAEAREQGLLDAFDDVQRIDRAEATERAIGAEIDVEQAYFDGYMAGAGDFTRTTPPESEVRRYAVNFARLTPQPGEPTDG